MENRGVRDGRHRIQVMLCALLFWILVLAPTNLRAASYAEIGMDAVSFYQCYGRETVFLPMSETDGYICYGTSAGMTPGAGVRFATIGWLVEFSDVSGAILETRTFAPGAGTLMLLDETQSGDRIYKLFGFRLSALEMMMNDAVRLAVEAGRCRIRLHACMTTVVDGVPQGAMLSDSYGSGIIYTTYEGIANAAGWTDTAREDLKSYYNKEVRGLFCSLMVSGDEGVEDLSGGGTYLYGRMAELRADVKEHYRFCGWMDASGNMLLQDETDPQEVLYYRLQGDMNLQAVTRSDFPPEILASDRFYPLDDAKAGRITEQEILTHVTASDPEDGNVETVLAEIIDGNWEDLREGADGASYAIRITARDSDGNEAEKEIRVTLADTWVRKGSELVGRTRFISESHLDTLEQDSVWRTKPDYRALLEGATAE